MKIPQKDALTILSLIPSDNDFKITGEVIEKFRTSNINDNMSSTELFAALSKINVTVEALLTAFKTSTKYPIFAFNGFSFVSFLYNSMPKGIAGFIQWLTLNTPQGTESEKLVFINLLRDVIRTNFNDDTLLSKALRQNCDQEVINFLWVCGQYSPAEAEKILHPDPKEIILQKPSIVKRTHVLKKRKESSEVKDEKPKRARQPKPSQPVTSFTDLKTSTFNYSSEEKLIKTVLDRELNDELDNKGQNTLKVLQECRTLKIQARTSKLKLAIALSKTTFTLKEFLMACKLSTLSNTFNYNGGPFVRLLFTFTSAGTSEAFTKWFRSKLTEAEKNNPLFKLLLKDVLRTSARDLLLIQTAFVKCAPYMQQFVIEFGGYAHEEVREVTEGLQNKRNNLIKVQMHPRYLTNVPEYKSDIAIELSVPADPISAESHSSTSSLALETEEKSLPPTFSPGLIPILLEANEFLSGTEAPQTENPLPVLIPFPVKALALPVSQTTSTPTTSIAFHPNSLFRPLKLASAPTPTTTEKPACSPAPQGASSKD